MTTYEREVMYDFNRDEVDHAIKVLSSIVSNNFYSKSCRYFFRYVLNYLKDIRKDFVND